MPVFFMDQNLFIQYEAAKSLLKDVETNVKM